jgi:RNA polymerase sigma-70 factor (ECF subfamily)
MSSSENNSPTKSLAERLCAARSSPGDALGLLLESFRRYLLIVAERRIPTNLKLRIPPSSAVQETILKGLQKFQDFRGQTENSFKGWLRRILLNHVANEIQRHRHVQKRQVGREVSLASIAGEELAKGLVADVPSPSGEAVASEEMAALHRGLPQLPELYRQVIEWRNYERLPFAEIGGRLGRTEEAARQLWRRAVEQLGEILGLPDNG